MLSLPANLAKCRLLKWDKTALNTVKPIVLLTVFILINNIDHN